MCTTSVYASHMSTYPEPWLELTVLRTKDGYSKASFARAAGISLSYLVDLEHGRRRPSARMLKLFAATLDVPVEVLEPRHLFTDQRSPEDIARDILTALHTIRGDQQDEQHPVGDAA